LFIKEVKEHGIIYIKIFLKLLYINSKDVLFGENQPETERAKLIPLIYEPDIDEETATMRVS